MRKITFLLILLFLSSSVFGIDVYLGLNQGFNVGMQYLAESELEHYGALIGYNGGFFTDLIFSELISFETGVLVSIRGGRMQDADLKEEMKLSYIDLPILFKLSKNIGFSILQLKLGTEVSFNLKGYRLYEDNGRNIEMDELNTRLLDIGAVIGGAMVFPIRDYYFSVEIRNTIGILTPFAEVTNRNLHFSLLFSYGFRI